MNLEPPPIGHRVRIIESVGSPSHGIWSKTTEGKLIDTYIEQRSALGNAYAGTESGEYPLTRLRLECDDGTLTDIVLDQNAELTVLE